MALLTEDGATNQQITAYELLMQRIDPYFLLFQLRGSENYLRATASTATIPILDAGNVSGLMVAVPPLEEQRNLVKQINDSTSDVNAALERSEREISLLQEFRTRLIADVVTGKLDVREAAAQLPDEVEEPESLMEEAAPADEEAELEAEAEEAAA
jgi:type I restriction enzyme, S subunit